MVPSANVASVFRGRTMPKDSKIKISSDPGVESDIGKSDRSISIWIGAEVEPCPDDVIPSAVREYTRHDASAGMAIENCAGTEVSTTLKPIGSGPRRATSENVVPLGEMTVTERVCPGFTMLPF